MVVKKSERVVKASVKPEVRSKSDDSLIGGLVLISIGLIFLVTNYYGWAGLWPLVFLIPISAIGISFFKDHDKGVIIPLTILTIIMLLFLSITLGVFAWSDMSWLWPVFIAAPGLGMLFFYLATGMKDSGMLIPISILLGLAALFMTGISTYWPVILIVIGLVVLLKNRQRQ